MLNDIKIVREFHYLEEKFDLFMRNFLEIEKELATRTVRAAYKMLRPEDFDEDKVEYNRLITNFLSSARMYLDQRRHHISEICLDFDSLRREVTCLPSEHYDGKFSYRLMEALRNYAQHRDLPIRGLTYHHRWIDRENLPDELEINVSIEISIRRILSDNSFKSKVREELRNLGDYMDIKHTIREYTESIYEIHSSTSSKLNAKFLASTSSLANIKSQFLSASEDDSVLGLAFVVESNEIEYEVTEYFPCRFVESIEKIRQDWMSLKKLPHRAISTRPRHLQD